MADSVLFYLSGDRVIDANGVAVSGATLHFFQAGTSNALTVYQDKDLLTPHSASIATTSGGQVPEIWLGTGNYKVDIRDSGGTSIAGYPRDNRKGALDTSGFSTTYAFREEPAISVTATSYTLLAANLGKVHDCNPSGGDIAFTLLDAVTAGDGAVAIIRHVGNSGNVAISAPSSQISPITLTRIGQSVTVTSNGATWRISAEAAGLFINRTPIINLVDRQTAPPSSPAAGSRYLINGTPTGAWASFAANDIVEYHAVAGWQRYTPAKGWMGYLEDDKFLVSFDGTVWVDWSNIAAPSTSDLTLAAFEDQKATNTSGGTPTVDQWLTRTVNTQVVNTITGMSLSSNRITIPVGRFSWTSSSSFFASGNTRTRVFQVKASGTCTISNGSPGVVTLTSHGLAADDEVRFTTSGALPTGLTAGVSYFVKTVLTADTFTVAATAGGSVINTSSAGSGTHTVVGGIALACSNNTYVGFTAPTQQGQSIISADIVVTGSPISVELQYRVSQTSADGLGQAHNITGFVERYSQITILNRASIQGPQGVAGTAGATGAEGASAGVRYTFDSTTTDAFPGSGELRFNNATHASTTQVYIADTNADAVSVGTWLDRIRDDNLSTLLAILKIEKIGDPSIYRMFNVTATETSGSYRKWTVAYLFGNGTIANADEVDVSFQVVYSATQARTRWIKTAVAAGTTTLSGTDDDGATLVYVPQAEALYVNGVRFVRGEDYTATNGSSITLTDPLATDSDIEVEMIDDVVALYAEDYVAGHMAVTALDGEEGVEFHMLSRGAAVRDYAAQVSDAGAINSVATFTRATTASYVDSEGFIQTAAAGVPRFTHSPSTLEPIGYLHERAATNSFLQSSSLATSPNSTSNATAGSAAATSIFGGATAPTLIENGATSTHSTSQTISVTSGTKYLRSAFVKANGRTRLDFTLGSGGFGALVRADFDLSAVTATLTTSGTNSWCGIEAHRDGWYRVWLGSEATATVGVATTMTLQNASGTRSYAGDGASGLYIDGNQFEVAAAVNERPSSLITTTTVSVTRNADSLSMDLTDTPLVARRGTIQVTATPRDVASAQYLAALYDTNETTDSAFLKVAAAGAVTGEIHSGSISQASLALGTLTAGTEIRASLAWKANDAVGDSDQVSAQTDASVTIPTSLDTLVIGSGFAGTIKEVKFLNRRLSNTDIASY